MSSSVSSGHETVMLPEVQERVGEIVAWPTRLVLNQVMSESYCHRGLHSLGRKTETPHTFSKSENKIVKFWIIPPV